MKQHIEAYRNDPEFQQKADALMAEVLTRSATDADFRRKLVESPAEALAEFTGKDASNFTHLDIAFAENTHAATIVLPDMVSTDELSESDMEAVAGGVIVVAPVVYGVIALTTAVATLAVAALDAYNDGADC